MIDMIETTYDEPHERIVIDRDDWGDGDWETILRAFNSEKADRIIVREYSIELHEGKEKS